MKIVVTIETQPTENEHVLKFFAEIKADLKDIQAAVKTRLPQVTIKIATAEP